MTNQLLQLGMPLLKSIIPSFGLKNILSHLYSSISSGDAVLTDWQSESSMGRMLLMSRSPLLASGPQVLLEDKNQLIDGSQLYQE